MASNQVVLGAGYLDDREIERLGEMNQRLGSVNTLVNDIQEISIAVAPAAGLARRMVLNYNLASNRLDASAAVGRLIALSAEEEEVLQKIVPAEVLFHWEDDELPANSRGSAVAVYAAVPMEASDASTLREMISQMLEEHKSGLIARARDVGYYREAMAFIDDENGKPVYLLYLEIRESNFRSLASEIKEYPDTPFNTWWTPRYNQLIGKHLIESAGSSLIIRWTRDGGL